MNLLKYQFKSIVHTFIIFFSVASLSSCQNNTNNEPKVTKFGNSNSAESPITTVPITYDVICFQRRSFSTMGVECSPDQIFKIPRGTKVTTYLKTETSVQQGRNINISFDTDKSTEKISISEMESLSSKDSQVYVMNSHLNTPLTTGILPAGYTAQVNIFDRSSGKFKVFGQGVIQQLGEDNSKFIFTAGDTDIKDTTGKVPEQPEPNQSVTSSQGSTHPPAERFIETYYQSLNERNYRNAWGKLSKSFQRKSEDYKKWWDKVKNIRVENVKSISQNENAAIVEAQISYELKDGRLKQDGNKQIHLLWNKAKNEWEIDK
jgi:hypothetical protein